MNELVRKKQEEMAEIVAKNALLGRGQTQQFAQQKTPSSSVSSESIQQKTSSSFVSGESISVSSPTNESIATGYIISQESIQQKNLTNTIPSGTEQFLQSSKTGHYQHPTIKPTQSGQYVNNVTGKIISTSPTIQENVVVQQKLDSITESSSQQKYSASQEHQLFINKIAKEVLQNIQPQFQEQFARLQEELKQIIQQVVQKPKEDIATTNSDVSKTVTPAKDFSQTIKDSPVAIHETDTSSFMGEETSTYYSSQTEKRKLEEDFAQTQEIYNDDEEEEENSLVHHILEICYQKIKEMDWELQNLHEQKRKLRDIAEEWKEIDDMDTFAEKSKEKPKEKSLWNPTLSNSPYIPKRHSSTIEMFRKEMLGE